MRSKKPLANHSSGNATMKQNQQMSQSSDRSSLESFDNVRISKNSIYSDNIWDWYDETNPRLSIYGKHLLCFDWEHHKRTHNLTDSIIKDLKKFAFFRLNYSKTFFRGTTKNAHPKTVIEQTRVLSAFLKHVRSCLSVGENSLINDLSDIEVQDLRDCLESYFGEDKSLKKIMSNLASEALQDHLDCGNVKWNIHDIKTLPWEEEETVSYERLPEKLFSFLSNKATADVKQFLKALRIDSHDKSKVEESDLFVGDFENFREVFESYVHFRSINKRGWGTSNKFSFNWTGGTEKAGIQMGKVTLRASLAARIILMLYTGARSSELVGFRHNCLRRRDDIWVITGTVIKGVDINAPSGQDEWVAIPIVRDAVAVLEQTGRTVNSEFLFHPSKSYSDFPQRKPMSTKLLSTGIRNYIDFVDLDQEWVNERVVPQQFRNSIAYELRKASLGLPFIAHQLKHMYSAFEKTVSDVTLSYGSIAGGSIEKAITDAHLLYLKEIYHPDSPVTGGGAEQHKRRRQSYFEGMIHRGFTVDEVLLQLAVEGAMPLTDVGLGYCRGQHLKVVDDDGVKTDPPCKGSLRCNPVVCQNAVIPEHKEPAWDRALVENLIRADDPYFAYARTSNLEAAAEAQSVVQFFQIERRRRKSDV